MLKSHESVHFGFEIEMVHNVLMNLAKVLFMATGIVKWFSKRKGYGFITPDGAAPGSPDVFVHFSQIKAETENEFRTLFQNDKVTFEAVASEKGQEARDVVVTEKAPRPPPRRGGPRRGGFRGKAREGEEDAEGDDDEQQ